MTIKDQQKQKLKTLHSIDEFGIRKVSMSNIRIEKLEDRIRPTVAFPHKHDFFQIMIVTGGTGWHQIDFKKFKLSAHQTFLMKPGQMHSWDLSKGVKGFVVEFNYQSLNSFKESARIINDLSFSPDEHVFKDKSDFEDLVKLTEIMINEFKLAREMSDLSLQGYLTSFLIHIIRSYQTQVNQQKTLSTIERLRDLVEKNYKNSHGVEFYAKELKTSAKALTMQLSRSIGKPPRQMIQERILLEAKRYLAFSDLSIAEIGYELGFDDANYFTRFFRQHEKKTPAKFRKEVSS